MATERILHPQWRDEQEPTKYPFADAATLRNDGGLFFPESIFLDATFYPIGGGSRLRISQVVVDYQEVSLVLGDDTNEVLATGTFPLLSPPDFIRFLDAYERPAGLIVSSSERLALFQAWPTGTHLFTVAQTELAATCCVPTPEIGVRGILLSDGSLFTGDIWLVGGEGIVLTGGEASTDRPGMLGGPEFFRTIRVDIVGDPLYKRRLCSTIFATPKFLQQITVQDGCRKVICLPDEYGDFKITVAHQDAVDTILRIRATEQGIVVEAVGEKLKSVK